VSEAMAQLRDWHVLRMGSFSTGFSTGARRGVGAFQPTVELDAV
jgi:hypothetical protein